MYLIIGATHADFPGIIQDLRRIYNIRNETIFSPILNLRETQALIRVKEGVINDIPSELRTRISNITIQVTDPFFIQREIIKTSSDWWPVDFNLFETLRAQGTYTGERVEQIYADRVEYRADAQDIIRDRRGQPPLPRL
jgi:hypothetical protein